MSHFFYCPDLSQNNLVLDEEESRHLTKSLRLGKGDRILVTDGKGNLCQAEISNSKTPITAKIIQFENNKSLSDNEIHLFIAPIKNPARMEWLIEKAVETGVAAIHILKTTHTEFKGNIKEERYRKIMIAAMKQSRRTLLPQLNATEKTIEEYCKIFTKTENFLAHCDDNFPRNALLNTLSPKQKNIGIFIGPEGDFSKEEIHFALQNNFHLVSLSHATLRTETAAIHALAVANSFFNAHPL